MSKSVMALTTLKMEKEKKESIVQGYDKVYEFLQTRIYLLHGEHSKQSSQPTDSSHESEMDELNTLQKQQHI